MSQPRSVGASMSMGRAPPSFGGSISQAGAQLDDDETLTGQHLDLPKSVLSALNARDPQASFLKNTMTQFDVFPNDVQARLSLARPRTTFTATLDDDENLDDSTSNGSRSMSRRTGIGGKSYPVEYLAASGVGARSPGATVGGGDGGLGSPGGGQEAGGGDVYMATPEMRDMLPIEPGMTGHSAGSALYDRAVENYNRRSQSRAMSVAMAQAQASGNALGLKQLQMQQQHQQHGGAAGSSTPAGRGLSSPSNHGASTTPKHQYIVRKDPDHLSKPEPDYSMLDPPPFLRDWGAELATAPRGAATHLRSSKLPQEMLLDSTTVGAPPLSSAWDANSALAEDVLFEASREQPDGYLADPNAAAAMDLSDFLATVTPNRSQPGVLAQMEGSLEYEKLMNAAKDAERMKAEEAQRRAQAPVSPPPSAKGPKAPPGKGPAGKGAKMPPGKGPAGKGAAGAAQSPAKKKEEAPRELPVGPLQSDYLVAPQHVAMAPEAMLQFMHQGYLEQLGRAGKQPPRFKSNVEPIKQTIKAGKHNPFGLGEYWDPFHQLGWWQKAKDAQFVAETAKVTPAGQNPKTGTPLFTDALGNTAPGIAIMHPLRRWMVDYFVDRGAPKGDPIAKNIDKWLMDNLKDPWDFENRLFQKLGPPKTIRPLSAVYNITFPEEAAITTQPVKWVEKDEAADIVVGNGPIIEVPKPVVVEPVVADEKSSKKTKDGKKDKKDKDKSSSDPKSPSSPKKDKSDKDKSDKPKKDKDKKKK